MEPPDGIESIHGGGLEDDFRGALIVTRRTLRPLSLEVAAVHGVAGIIESVALAGSGVSILVPMVACAGGAHSRPPWRDGIGRRRRRQISPL